MPHECPREPSGVSPGGCGLQLLATRIWPRWPRKLWGPPEPSRTSCLSITWSQALQPQAQWPTQNLGRLGYGEKGPALAELLSYPEYGEN